MVVERMKNFISTLKHYVESVTTDAYSHRNSAVFSCSLDHYTVKADRNGWSLTYRDQIIITRERIATPLGNLQAVLLYIETL